MPYNRKSPMPMMIAGKKKLEKDNPPPVMVQLDTTPQVRGGAGLLGFVGGNVLSAGKQLLGGASRLFRTFTNAPKQYMRGATKNVPVVGQPGKTVKVPKSSKTKQVSYVNPRISMTAAERAKAGY